MPQDRRCALFVDFDNMFLGLKEDSPEAAERFATAPSSWIDWIMHMDEKSNRSILLRKCYLNPKTFGTYRTDFARQGFCVVDCPALTQNGKNSADIIMVMDILDALAHSTRFDEFIILSADTDFTPIFLRLRENDRRTMAIVSVPVSAAFRGACDLIVEEGDFVRDALKVENWQEACNVKGHVCAQPPPVPFSMTGFKNRIHELVNIPRHDADYYRQIFEALSRVSTAHTVYDVTGAVCVALGANGRDQIAKMAGAIFPVVKIVIDKKLWSNDPNIIAGNFYDHVMGSLSSQSVELTAVEKERLKEWLCKSS